MMDKKRKKVEQYIEQYQMIGRGDRIVTGVSGGADSVCLLFVLCELRKKLGFEVIVCHVNHQLRAEAAEQDEAYVKELCRKLDVPCRIFHENVELIAKNGKKSLEEAGRIVRSNAFETVCRESGANKIATAHHKNDNAETVLLNLARGSGLQGMCGIRPVYGNRIRPLLCLTRKEIEEWLEEEQISYCTDETNEEDEYTRNRIRHKILPVMEQEINRQTVEHINRLSLQAEEIWEYLNLQTDAAWRQMVHPVDVSEENPEEKQQGKKEEKPAGLRIEEEEYAELPGILQSLLIRRCICEMAEAQKDIEAVHMEAVRGLFGRQVGKRLCTENQRCNFKVIIFLQSLKQVKPTHLRRLYLTLYLFSELTIFNGSHLLYSRESLKGKRFNYEYNNKFKTEKDRSYRIVRSTFLCCNYVDQASYTGNRRIYSSG